MKTHDFERSVRNILNGTAAERRWKIFEGVTFETVDTHTLKQILLVMWMLYIEKSIGNPHKLDMFRLLVQALIHDLPEGHLEHEDVNYHHKRANPAVKQAYKEKEAVLHKQIMTELFGEFYAHIVPLLLDMDEEAPEQDKLFWEASEHISHSMFMLEEIRLDTVAEKQQSKFHSDIKNIHTDWIRSNAWHFESARYIVINEIDPKWRGFIEKFRR